MLHKNVSGPGADAEDDFAAGDPGSESKGDGMHHHEIHEDEGGGYHSKHTHPDGREEHEDHATYEDARDWMDEMHGHGEPDGDEGDGEEMPDDEPDASSYERACK